MDEDNNYLAVKCKALEEERDELKALLEGWKSYATYCKDRASTRFAFYQFEDEEWKTQKEHG